jgi:hypothetical protein
MYQPNKKENGRLYFTDKDKRKWMEVRLCRRTNI